MRCCQLGRLDHKPTRCPVPRLKRQDGDKLQFGQGVYKSYLQPMCVVTEILADYLRWHA